MGRCNAYSERHYTDALAAFAVWTGFTNDFKPARLPQYFTISHRARFDKSFAKQFAAANELRLRNLGGAYGGGRKRRKYSDAHYDKYLDAIRTSTCRCKSDFRYQERPGLPDWNSAKYRAANNPEYAEKLQAALESKGWQKGSGLKRRKSGNYGSVVTRYTDAEFLASIEAFSKFTKSSAFYYKPRHGLPSYPAIQRRIRKSEIIAAAFEAAQSARIHLICSLGLPLPGPIRVGRGHKRVITQKQKAAYIAAISAGASRRTLEKTTPVSREVRERLCREDPAFSASISQANHIRLAAKFEASKAKRKDRQRERDKKRRRGAVYDDCQLRIQLNLNDYYATADSALRGYRQIPTYALDDIRSDMVEALIDGTLLAEEASERAFEYVGNYNREFSPHRHKSTDQKLFDDGNATAGDYLTTDDYSYAE